MASRVAIEERRPKSDKLSSIGIGASSGRMTSMVGNENMNDKSD